MKDANNLQFSHNSYTAQRPVLSGADVDENAYTTI